MYAHVSSHHTKHPLHQHKTHNKNHQSLRDYSRPEEARLRAVYRDLWERGLTVGCGSPYGADFTAYEGTYVGGWVGGSVSFG